MHLKVRLLVKNPNGNLRYTTIDEYLALMPVSVVDETICECDWN